MANKKQKYCLNCNIELINRQSKFCSNACQQDWNYKEYIKRWKAGLEDGLCGEYGISSHIRRYIFNKYNNKCTKCGWGEKNPYTGNIPLEIEHIDGNYKNNKEENLTLLCPNCHSLTPTYKGANVGHGRLGRKKYSEQYSDNIQSLIPPNKNTTEKIKQKIIKERNISREFLKQEIRNKSFVQIGKEQGVSDNAIRKWCKSYNLPSKSSEIKKYSDEEWNNI